MIVYYKRGRKLTLTHFIVLYCISDQRKVTIRVKIRVWFMVQIRVMVRVADCCM